jgi:hypothetical protein
MERWIDRVLTRERILRVSIAILVVNAVLYAALVARGRFPFDARGTLVLPDFMAHLTGGALVASGNGRELYALDAQSTFQVGITHAPRVIDVFLSPPLAAWIYAPFAKLPYARAAVAWTTVSLALLALSARSIARLTPSVSASDRRVFFVAVAASQPVIQLLGCGQDTAISLLLWCAGTELALRRSDAAAGATFALGLFKPQLFVLAPLVFIALRRWRAVAGWVATALGLAGLTVLLFTTDGVRDWLRVLGSPEYLVSLHVGRALRMGSVMPMVLSALPDSMAAVADYAGKVLCVGILGVAARRILRARAEDAVDERGAWALACVTTLLVTPHLFDYDLALVALPAALLLEMGGVYSSAERGAIVALALLTWTAAARGELEGAAWPLRLFSASWAAIPMFVLWRAIPIEPARVTRSGGTVASRRPGG